MCVKVVAVVTTARVSNTDSRGYFNNFFSGLLFKCLQFLFRFLSRCFLLPTCRSQRGRLFRMSGETCAQGEFSVTLAKRWILTRWRGCICVNRGRKHKGLCFSKWWQIWWVIKPSKLCSKYFCWFKWKGFVTCSHIYVEYWSVLWIYISSYGSISPYFKIKQIYSIKCLVFRHVGFQNE